MIAVLHVTRPTDGGVARYVADAVADQIGRGWRVAVACPPDGWLARTLAGGGVPVLPWTATRAPHPGTINEVLRLRAYVAGFRPDVVHLHSSKAGYAGRLALRGRLPTLFQPHGWSWLAVTGPVARTALAWERRAARWTDLVVCVGIGEAGLMRQGRITGRRVVVRNGVDATRFTPGNAGSGRPLAVCVGRVSRQKGQDLLLRAWPAVLARCPDAELAIVGPGPGQPGFRNGVRFVGAVDDVRPWYRAADVVVLPSRWEGLPLTALEAMACGTSVVAADVPGLAEIVTGPVGALVRGTDPEKLADAVAARLTDRPRARAEGAAGRALMLGEFDQRVTFERLADATSVISRVMRSRDRPFAGGLPAGRM